MRAVDELAAKDDKTARVAKDLGVSRQTLYSALEGRGSYSAV